MPNMTRYLFALFLMYGLWMGLAPVAGAAVILNEVLADPMQDWDGDGELSFKGDEWIEVVNIGATDIDLSSYYLRDIFGTDPHLQLSGVLAPGQAAVFYGSQSMAWQRANGYSDYGFALNNNGETVELLRELGEPGALDFELVDTVTLQAHETEDDRSSGWALDGSGWTLFDGLNDYGGTQEPGPSGCVPTPGEPNTCELDLPVSRESLGGLKSLYR